MADGTDRVMFVELKRMTQRSLNSAKGAVRGQTAIGFHEILSDSVGVIKADVHAADRLIGVTDPSV